MKKYLLAVCLLFALTGCGQKTDSQTPQTTLPETTAEVTEAPASETQTADETQIVSETTETSETPETEAPASQTGILGAAVPETMEVHETVPHEDGTLLGTWQWADMDETRIVFRADDSALVMMDYSSLMRFENHMLQYNGVPCDTLVAGDLVTAEIAGETFLQMSAMEGVSAQELQGEFLLEDCIFYQTMAAGNEDAVYYILLDGDKCYVEAIASYEATEDTLQLSWSGDALSANYYFSDGHLCLAYDDGSSEFLERVQ